MGWAVRVLESLRSPVDLQQLPADRLPGLAAEIRAFLVEKVSATGGHLGPNLGVVELTIALHRVFTSPRDALLFDTGHQSYVHKILTGRAHQFDTLRKQGGLSGYPSRSESVHDWIENSHASTSLSYADGLAKAWELTGELGRRHVVAVIGDGALTGGMAWEALNNIAGSDRQVIIVVNDNGRSYSPTIGGLARHLTTLRTTGGYEKFLHWGKQVLHRTPVVGDGLYGALHGMKKGVKDMVAPQGMFEDLGLKYIGPIDGHDEAALEHAFTLAKAFPGPVIVHALTHKGHGYAPAEQDEAEKFHGIGVIDPDTGMPLANSGPTWTSAFAEQMQALGAADPNLVAITAAMLGPTGLESFARTFPARTFDVGIAEQHAATSAAGLAMGGMHPVVALYATFLNRGYDQVLMDCALHKLPVTFALDRAGITGDDGASHNGVWDLSLMGTIPGIAVAAPRDGQVLAHVLAQAVAVADHPTVVRYPKGPLPAPIPAIRHDHGADVLFSHGDADVLIVSVGAMATMAMEAAAMLVAHGFGVRVIDPLWVIPISQAVIDHARQVSLVAVIEDGIVAGGIGAQVMSQLHLAQITVPVRSFGVRDGFMEHAKRADLLIEQGLSAQQISRALAEDLSRNASGTENAVDRAVADPS